MILDLTQYSLNKDHLHHKWQPPRSWISHPDCQGCDGQAADAVSANTQVKMEDAHKLLKIPKSECPDIRIRLPRHKWPKSWSSMEDPVVSLERNLYGHPLAGLLWERQFEKILLKHGWGKIPNCEWLFVHREKGLFLSVYVDDIKLAGKKQNLDPMWKLLNKEVDLGEPTSFLDHVYLGCTQRHCEISKDLVDNYRATFESRISAGEQKSFRTLRIFVFLHGLMIWKVMQRNVWSDIVSWRTKRLNNPTKYQLHALMTIISKKKKWNPWENCQKYALKFFWNAYTWHVLDDPIFYGQWTNLHDRSQNGPKLVTNDYLVLISYIHHTCAYKHYCHVGNTAKQCRLGLFQDSDFAGDLEDSKSTSGGTLCIFGSHTFVPQSWMCKKQTSVSHSSTESEIISLDTGLRLDGIPALDLWDRETRIREMKHGETRWWTNVKPHWWTSVFTEFGFGATIWKNTKVELYYMEGHAKKCVGRYCESCEQNDWAIFLSRNAMHGWPSNKRRKMDQLEN